MAVTETILVGLAIGLCLLLGWAIDRYGAVGLIAGYQKGDLPPKQERELATDIRNLLLVVSVLLAVLLIDVWTDQIPYADVLLLVVSVLLVGRIIWKYNDL